MNASCEFARHACRADGAVTIDESQSGPHRGAPRPQGLADRLWLVYHGIGKLRPWIHAEIKPLRIQRRRFKQFLRKIVSRNSAVCRDAEIRDEQSTKCHHNWRPPLKFGIA